MSERARLWIGAIAAVVGGIAAIVSAQLTWARVTVKTSFGHAGQTDVVIRTQRLVQHGRDAQPVLLPLALLLIAAGIAALLVRPRVRTSWLATGSFSSAAIAILSAIPFHHSDQSVVTSARWIGVAAGLVALIALAQSIPVARRVEFARMPEGPPSMEDAGVWE